MLDRRSFLRVLSKAGVALGVGAVAVPSAISAPISPVPSGMLAVTGRESKSWMALISNPRLRFMVLKFNTRDGTPMAQCRSELYRKLRYLIAKHPEHYAYLLKYDVLRDPEAQLRVMWEKDERWLAAGMKSRAVL